MASGYSPAAIQACFDAIHDVIPAAINAGIYGNKPGYHNCRAQCSPNDYSVQKPDDRVGDVWAGSAVDVTMYATSDMKRATQNLINATKAGDKRLLGLREFFGTLDGVNVTGMDVRGKYYVTSDDSHLWHVHLSFYRKYATNTAACLDIAEVFTGTAQAPAPQEDDVPDHSEVQMLTEKPLNASDPVELVFTKVVQDPGNMWGDNPDTGKGYLSMRVSNRPFVSTLALTVTDAPVGTVVLTSIVYLNSEGGMNRQLPWKEITGDGYVYVTDSRNGVAPKGGVIRVTVQASKACTIKSADWDVLAW